MHKYAGTFFKIAKEARGPLKEAASLFGKSIIIGAGTRLGDTLEKIIEDKTTKKIGELYKPKVPQPK